MTNDYRWIETESLLDIALLVISRMVPGIPSPKSLFVAPSGDKEGEMILYFVLHHFDKAGDGTTYMYFARVPNEEIKGNYLLLSTDSRGVTQVAFSKILEEDKPRTKVIPLVKLKKRPDFP